MITGLVTSEEIILFDKLKFFRIKGIYWLEVVWILKLGRLLQKLLLKCHASQMITFADDIILFAKKEEELENILNGMDKLLREKFGL